MDNRVIYIIGVIVLSLGLQAVDQVVGEPTSSGADLLSGLTKVLNAGVCALKVMAKSAECTAKAGDDWKNADREKKAACCLTYDVIDCMRGQVSKECGSSDGKDTDAILRKWAEALHDGECSDYGYRWYQYTAWKCHIPWILIGVVAVTTIIIIVVAVYFLWK